MEEAVKKLKRVAHLRIANVHKLTRNRALNRALWHSSVSWAFCRTINANLVRKHVYAHEGDLENVEAARMCSEYWRTTRLGRRVGIRIP